MVGGILLRVSGTSVKDGTPVTTVQLFYVSRAVQSAYFSLETCTELGIVHHTFPGLGHASSSPTSTSAHTATLAGFMGLQAPTTPHLPKCSNTGVLRPGDPVCACPTRTLPPSQPPVLPCEPTQANIPRLKQYILNRYRSSAFNTCERQALPLMTGSPPLRLHVKPEAPPTAVHTPAQVPLHWQEAVRGGLDRDVRLGVLEPVPLNEPSRWVSRMVVTPKANGEPRRVVDYQPLNRHAPRQTHHTQSPWTLVSSVPAGMKKTVLDCFHGYHSVPVAEEDWEYTTFITPWGRYRYRTCPQGFLSAGDGYNHRMDLIIGDFERCVWDTDDSLIWDLDIKSNFFRTCKFLDLCAAHGCVFNPEKFQFAEDEVQYLGFTINNTGVQPTTSFLDSLKSFPTPQNLTDVCSWFGAVAQIFYSFASAPEMLPFRHLLSSKSLFSWSPALEAAFLKSKEEIVNQCSKGVRSFDPLLPTALGTDWSHFGIGFWLCQKHCDCEKMLPGCCPSGWQTIFWIPVLSALRVPLRPH